MDELPEQGEPANLRFLRRLVTTLTATMIIGLVVLIGLVVIRMQSPGLALPEQITLPDGATPQAYTRGNGWYAVVTDDDRILIFNSSDGVLRQEIQID